MANIKELGRNPTEIPVGKYGGRGPSDICGPQTNVTPKPSDDEDHDGKVDFGVSRELSEDVNSADLRNSMKDYKAFKAASAKLEK